MQIYEMPAETHPISGKYTNKEANRLIDNNILLRTLPRLE